MAQKKRAQPTTESLLQDILITQLSMAGLTQHQIREAVGVDMHRVVRLVKHMKKRDSNEKGA